MKNSSIIIILIWAAIFVINIIMKNAKNKKNAENKEMDEQEYADTESEDYEAERRMRQMLEGHNADVDEKPVYIEEYEEKETSTQTHTMMTQKYDTQEEDDEYKKDLYLESMDKIAQYENIIANQEREIERLGFLVDTYKIKEEKYIPSVSNENTNIYAQAEQQGILGTEEMMKNAIIYNAILERRGGKI